MILNGGGYGLTANHSLVMANYLARANAAVINLSASCLTRASQANSPSSYQVTSCAFVREV